MSDKILSVIVPSYNMEKYLPKCLGSLVVAPELMERLEVLVVNDGSRDRTSEIAHEFELKWPATFRVIDKKNGNYGSCINAALPCVVGFYVKILDADDYVETENFALCLEILAKERVKGDVAADLCVTGYDQVDEDGNVTWTCNYMLGSEGYKTLAEVPEKSPAFAVQSVAYKTENLRRIGYRQTEGVSYTDTEWVIEPMVTVERILYLPQVATHYLVGRIGQTMESATFARRFQQVVDITAGIIARHDSMLKYGCSVAVPYYERRIVSMIRMVCRACVLGWNGHVVHADLVSFDKMLASHSDLYDAVKDERVSSRFFDFYYLLEWRKNRSRRTLKFMLFDIYELLIRLRRGFFELFAKRCVV